MKVSIEKLPVKFLWIDTNVIITLAKWRVGRELNAIEAKRAEKIFSTIYELSRTGKLLCPMAEQDDEYEVGQRLVEECRRIQAELSLGIRMRPQGSIEDAQIYRAMKAYIEQSEEIHFPYRDIFYGDPVKDLLAKKNLIITAHIPDTHNQIEHRRKTAKNIAEEWEKLRQANIKSHVSFEQQLEAELNAYIKTLLQIKKRTYRRFENNSVSAEDILAYTAYSLPLIRWKELCGKPSDEKGLIQFCLSPTFQQIPLESIRCKLSAKLITGPSPIKISDPMDVNNLSGALPFVHFILTDRQMKNLLKGLRLNEEYNASIFALEDFEEFLKVLHA